MAHVTSALFKEAQKTLPPHLAATPKIVNVTVEQDDWSELGEMAMPALGRAGLAGPGFRAYRAPRWRAASYGARWRRWPRSVSWPNPDRYPHHPVAGFPPGLAEAARLVSDHDQGGPGQVLFGQLGLTLLVGAEHGHRHASRALAAGPGQDPSGRGVPHDRHGEQRSGARPHRLSGRTGRLRARSRSPRPPPNASAERTTVPTFPGLDGPVERHADPRE